MKINKRQIGILLFTLFVLLAGLIFYSHTLIVDGLNQSGTLSVKSRRFIIEWLTYMNFFLILEFIIGCAATILLISQKHISQNPKPDQISDSDIYQNEDLIPEKKEVIKKDKINELRDYTIEIDNACKKNSTHYDFCKTILSIVGKHLPLVQGAFYNTVIFNNEDYIELTAGYAFNKPEKGKIKYLFGEGLAGQTAKSRETAMITEIPLSYLEINSGLGSSQTVALYEFPLLRKKEIIGVIELAFFKKLTKQNIREIQKSTSVIAKRVVELKKDIQN